MNTIKLSVLIVRSTSFLRTWKQEKEKSQESKRSHHHVTISVVTTFCGDRDALFYAWVTLRLRGNPNNPIIRNRTCMFAHTTLTILIPSNTRPLLQLSITFINKVMLHFRLENSITLFLSLLLKLFLSSYFFPLQNLNEAVVRAVEKDCMCLFENICNYLPFQPTHLFPLSCLLIEFCSEKIRYLHFEPPLVGYITIKV